MDAVNGAFMLVRAAAIRDVGLLDEGYWLYMEDLDWCYRFWQRGWTVFYEPSGVVLHVKGGTSGARRGLRREVAFHRGMGRFYRKFYAPNGSPFTAAVVYLGIGVKLLAQPGGGHGVAQANQGVPPVSPVNAVQAGFGSRSAVNRPVWKNQIGPGTSRHEYQMTPAIFRRPRLAAIIPKALRR